MLTGRTMFLQIESSGRESNPAAGAEVFVILPQRIYYTGEMARKSAATHGPHDQQP